MDDVADTDRRKRAVQAATPILVIAAIVVVVFVLLALGEAGRRRKGQDADA